MDAQTTTPLISQVLGFVAGFAVFGVIVGEAIKLAFDRYTSTLHENEELKAEATQKQFQYLTEQLTKMSDNFQRSVDKLESIIRDTVNRVSSIEAEVKVLRRERRCES